MMAHPRLGQSVRVHYARRWGAMPLQDRVGVVRLLAADLIRGLGYRCEWRELRACDYGAPTIRKRFFLVARRDGEPIRWPEPTHGPGRPRPYRTAAECLDWSRPCPSIFMTREEAAAYTKATGRRVIRPLKPKTLARIAAGVKRYVLDAGESFIVRYNGVPGAGDYRVQSVAEPASTLDRSNRLGVVVPSLVSIANYGGNGLGVRPADAPLSTVTANPKGGHHALVAAFLHGCGGRAGQSRPRGTDEPVATVTGKADVCLSAAHLLHLRGTSRDGQPVDSPAPTLTSGGQHVGMVAAFLQTYYGASVAGQPADAPAPTVTTRDRLGLVVVCVRGEPYVIADIGMRMLEPDELLRCQFGEHADGWVLLGSKSQQVAGIGNSVCPHVARAIVAANVRVRVARRADMEDSA